MVKSKLLLISFCVVLICIACNSVTALAAVILNIDGNGYLMGASNVIVNEKAYNVTFVEGTAQDLFFDGTSWNFTFNDYDSAFTASEALLANVFIDTPFGFFDTSYDLTYGITPNNYYGAAITPFQDVGSGITVNVIQTINSAIEANDKSVYLGSLPTNLDSSSMPAGVYAVWNPVPVPSALLLLASGLLGLVGVSRKKTA